MRNYLLEYFMQNISDVYYNKFKLNIINCLLFDVLNLIYVLTMEIFYANQCIFCVSNEISCNFDKLLEHLFKQT